MNLPKVVLMCPSQNKANDEPQGTTFRTNLKFREMVKNNHSQTMQELHEARMKNLRKDMDYLKESEWKYEPIDKYIGQ